MPKRPSTRRLLDDTANADADIEAFLGRAGIPPSPPPPAPPSSPPPSPGGGGGGGGGDRNLAAAIAALTKAVEKLASKSNGKPADKTPKGAWGKVKKGFSTLADTRLGRWVGRKGKGLAARLGKTKLGRLGGKAASLGKGGAAALGKMAGVAGAVLMLGEAAVEAYRKLDQWTEQLQAGNKRLAEFSGSMAAVMAQRDVAEMQRMRERGDEVAASAEWLTDAENKRKDNTQEILILAQRLENSLGAFVNEIAANLIAPINDIAEAINNWIGREKTKSMDASDWLAGGPSAKQAEEYAKAVLKAKGINVGG